MKTLGITEAKRRLPELIESGEAFSVTRNGEFIGTPKVRYVIKPNVTPEQQAEACRRLREMARKVRPLKDGEEGVTAELRRMRDDGIY